MGDHSTLSRRTLFLAAGIGTLAAPLVLNRAGARAQSETDATDMRPSPLETRSLKLGSFRILTVRDGIRPSGAPNETFGIDQSAEAVGTLLEENFLPADTFVNSFTPTLVDTGAEVVLFDTGMGEGGRKAGMGRLLEGLKYAGYTPDQISVVVITHMHGDHIGGLLEGDKPAFPNARYVTGRTEYDFWVNPEPWARLPNRATRACWPRCSRWRKSSPSSRTRARSCPASTAWMPSDIRRAT